MKRVVLFGSTVLLLLVFLHFRTGYQLSAQKGVDWLLNYPQEYGNQGVFWALKDIATRFCPSSELGRVVTERFESAPRTEVEKAYFYFPQLPITEEVLRSASAARYDTWLLEALSCRERGLSNYVREELRSVESARGYDLTHKYTALLYLERLDCTLPEVSLPERIRAAEKAIAEEERTGAVFSDLSAERAALLLWGGRQDLVNDTWLNRIKDAQGSAGGWGDGVGAAPNPHTTALAAWALVQADSQCPL